MQAKPMESRKLFEASDIISSYSRATALEDGELVALPIAAEAGVKFPCAMTRALYAAIDPTPAEAAIAQDLPGRLWDMLTIFKIYARRDGGAVIKFAFIVRRAMGPRGADRVQVRAVCGPGDDAAPVITFMLPDED